MDDADRPAHAPDLTVDEFEQRDPRPRLKRSHLALVVTLIMIAMLVLVLVFAHRMSPCHLQITRINGTAADLEQCVHQ